MSGNFNEVIMSMNNSFIVALQWLCIEFGEPINTVQIFKKKYNKQLSASTFEPHTSTLVLRYIYQIASQTKIKNWFLFFVARTSKINKYIIISIINLCVTLVPSKYCTKLAFVFRIIQFAINFYRLCEASSVINVCMELIILI